MLTIKSTVADFSASAKTANGLVKRLRAAGMDHTGFAVETDKARIVALVRFSDASEYDVCIGERFVRKIPRGEVVGTARLYVDGLRLRKKLNSAETMIIRAA
jgi:hypothetical protein